LVNGRHRAPVPWFLQISSVSLRFRGTSLRPVPPGASKHKDVRYFNIYEDQLDEAQTPWVKQASQLPGARM
jgi:hypothetical protein